MTDTEHPTERARAMKAYIVWNEDRSEGVIFAESESDDPAAWPLTAADDAAQACTGTSKISGIGSALAEAFDDLYDDGERSIQIVDVDALRSLGHD